MPGSLLQFIAGMCEDYGIDESHGLKHAIGTMVRAEEILEGIPDIGEEERKMALYAAALHDTCDHKYTDVKNATDKIKEWLLTYQYWTEKDADALIHIITTMSYSQLKRRMVNGNPVYPDHGKWQRAYHIARHADLLEGYIVARCILYDRHIYPTKSEDAHWKRAEELFRDRVFTCVSEGWLFMPEALKEVPRLEAEAIRCLKERSLDWRDISKLEPFSNTKN